MQLYKIEKGVKLSKPSHPKVASSPSKAALTMAALEKGDSFFIKDALEAMKASKSVQDMNRNRNGGTRRFAARRIDGGLRIWRVK